MLNKNTYNRVWATIIEGSIRVRSNETVEGAIKRDYELKDGTKGFKWELHYKSLSGKIENIEFRDGDYGKMLEITIDGTTLSVGVKTNYGTDLMKKLPEADLNSPVELTPYAFTDDQGKLRKGITVRQNNKKIPSYFHIMDGGKFKAIHGFPIPVAREDGEKYKKNDWILLYLRIEDFLVKYTEDNIIPKLKKTIATEINGTESVIDNEQKLLEEDEELRTSEIPF